VGNCLEVVDELMNENIGICYGLLFKGSKEVGNNGMIYILLI